MRRRRSLQARIAVSLGVSLTVLWVVAASITAVALRHEMDEVFDSALEETAQRILPLAVVEIVGREETGLTQRLAVIREHEEYFSYIVRDALGRVLLQSHNADPKIFPAYDGRGFRQTAEHRFYNEDALRGSIRITVAEPLDHRVSVSRGIQMGLGLPLLFVIPIALLAIIFAVQASLAPLRRFRERLEARSARDLSPVPSGDLPAEIAPMADTLNDLLRRLNEAFDSERSFAANAAHELRTPVAGAIAQAQRLQSESDDPATRKRAADIEATLKRLTRLAERLMQLARAEGGRLRMDQASDLRGVLRLVAEDVGRVADPGRIRLTCSDAPVMSDIDPDTFGIVCRNLIENALRHGQADTAVDVTLSTAGVLSVANEGAVVPQGILGRLTGRFERGSSGSDGSGLGLAIVATIANRLGVPLELFSPRPGHAAGFEVRMQITPASEGEREGAGVRGEVDRPE